MIEEKINKIFIEKTKKNGFQVMRKINEKLWRKWKVI